MSSVPLTTEVSKLANRFLDAQIPLETDPNFQPDLYAIAAFRLLVHAEIEHWVESKAREGVAEMTGWIKAQTAAKNLRRMFICALMFDEPLALCGAYDASEFCKSAERLLGKVEKYISDNNSIKADSFTRLACVWGIAPDEIDGALLARLNEYGKQRGDVAHTSVKKVATLNAPGVEKSAASTLAMELTELFSVTNKL